MDGAKFHHFWGAAETQKKKLIKKIILFPHANREIRIIVGEWEGGGRG